MAAPVEKERSVMDRVRAGELTLADIVPVKAAAPERAEGFRQETVEMETPREERTPAPRREGRRAAREEEKPAERNLAVERPTRSDDFDVAFEEETAPQKGAGKKKKGGDEDFLF
jgi:hypothetical protein